MKSAILIATITMAVAAIPGAGTCTAQDADDQKICSDSSTAANVRISICTQLIDSSGPDTENLPELYVGRGNAYAAREDFAAAIADYTEALRVDPNNATAYRRRGEANRRLKQYEPAEADLLKAISLDPNGDWAHNYLARVYFAKGDYEKSIEEFSKAVSLNPKSINSTWNRGNAYYRNQNYQEAVNDFTTASQLSPLNAGIYWDRATANEKLGNLDAAIFDSRMAVLLDPNMGGAQVKLSELAPDRNASETGPIGYSAPVDGLVVDYLRLLMKAGPERDPMVEALDDLVGMFARKKQPLPLDKAEITFEIGATGDDGRTPITNQAGLEFASGLLPAALPGGGPVPDVVIDYDFDELWHLAPGQSTAGTATALLQCPEKPTPMTVLAGCLGTVDAIELGNVEWSASFAGWEYVLVPAGQRLAAKVEYSENRKITFFGVTDTVSARYVWWLDPEIGWWVKRLRSDPEVSLDSEVVEVLEAMTIRLPPEDK
jgi:tetratricopeptide (TPR) repeat protein